jgi:ATP-dependent DNA helicase RecQ
VSDKDSLLWVLAYQLSGCTILGRTESEPLGSLPIQIRTAVLEVAHEIDPEDVLVKINKRQLIRVVDPRHANYKWVEQWRFANNEKRKILRSNHSNQKIPFKSVDEFIHVHNLDKPEDDSFDEHYAERLFLKDAFLPVFGVHGLSFLSPQFAFRDQSGRERRVDFVFHGVRKYAFEVEGSKYHDSAIINRDRFRDEKKRQRSLSDQGFIYKPFALDEIKGEDTREYLRKMALEDPILKGLLELELSDKEHSQKPTLIYIMDLLNHFPKKYPLYQKIALTILCKAIHQGKNKIVIADWSPMLALLSVALLDTVALIERVARLYGLEVELPKVDIHIVGPYDKYGVYEVLRKYLGAEPGQGDQRVDFSMTPVNLYFNDNLPDADYVFADEAMNPCKSKDCISGASLERFPDMFLEIANRQIQLELPKMIDREILDYFARRYFLVPELKERQFELLVKILNQESVLGILPTSYGKSLVFQLYALLIPRTTLVICPLRSLIRDQIQNLQRQGLLCAESITSYDNRSGKDKKYEDLQGHNYRLLYISPERLREKEFYCQIKSTLENSPVGAIVVDEAHCVSEWGHDFRPSYLQIDRFRKTIEKATRRMVPIIALTATASKDVKEDIRRVLNLPEEAVIQKESSDRTNLSLSVWKVGSSSTAKSNMLKHIITEKIPRALNMPFEELVPVNGKPPYDNAGIIFGIYAAPSGYNTAPEGVHFISQKLVKNLLKDNRLINVYASEPPRLCSSCDSPRLVDASDDDLVRAGIISKKGLWPTEDHLKCEDCDMVLPKREARKDANWEKKILQCQEEFHQSQFPLLVATKGFGMGIDKRNIRFIVHHSFASGLEGYYQEAGRAGRDGDHAHVALMYVPPDQQCENDWLKDKSPPKPPCASGRWRCAYNLQSLCDYGKQARFIEQSYIGIERDLKTVMKVYRSLEQGENIRSRKGENRSSRSKVKSEEEDEYKFMELALYRLQQLGLVEGYSMRYLSWNETVFDPEYKDDWKPGDVISNLIEILNRTEAGKKFDDEARGLQNISLIGENRNVRGENFITEAVRILLKLVYDTVPNMRYQMLTDEKNYAVSKQCRRITLRSIFDTEQNHSRLVDSNYHCNFCDVCVPDLRFPRSEAEIPVYEAELDEIAKSIHLILERFDVEAMKKAVRTVFEKKADTSLLVQMTYQLEQKYNDPGTLFMAGTLSRHRGEQKEALRYLRDGFKFGVQREFKTDSLLAFYQEASAIDAKEAFSWIAEAKGPWDSTDGLEFLAEEAFQCFGKRSQEYRHTFALWKLRKYGEISMNLGNILQKVDSLRMLKETAWPA